jgi:hypothetical protein
MMMSCPLIVIAVAGVDACFVAAVAPEVLKSGLQTKASDVYAFGVLVSGVTRCAWVWVL